MITPEKLVQQQLDAYNAKDINAWLATYDSKATQYSMDGEILAQGHENMASLIKVRFQEPDLHAKLLNRMVCDDVVIDHERITRNFPEGKGSVEMLCIYKIVNNLIISGHFKVFNKQLACP